MAQQSEGAWRRHIESETRSTPAELRAETTPKIPVLTVMGHPDLDRIGERSELFELFDGGEVALSRLQPLFSVSNDARRRPLADPHLSRRPIRLRPHDGGLLIDGCQTKTPVRVRGEIPSQQIVLSTDQLARGTLLILAGRIVLWLQIDRPTNPHPSPRFGLIGESSAINELRRQIQRAADSEIPVLLRGETGAGKELVAQALHRAGQRRKQPFVAVNMAALPPSLASAELFGAVKGAFTGAEHKRRGYFERADGGTLFLDEIADTAPEVQASLLRALETREIQPLGSDRLRAVDIRLIAATDADLETAVARGNFRAPLLHRLGGFEIHVPALRQRRDDIPRLFVQFLKQELASGIDSALAASPWSSATLIADLVASPWPGNVRQLRNITRQIAVVARDGTDLESSDEIRRILCSVTERTAVSPSIVSDPEPAQPGGLSSRLTDDELIATLRRHRFRLKPTAAALGISRPALYRRIEKSARIRTAKDCDGEELEQCRAACGGDLDAMAERLEISRHGLTRRMNELGLRPD